MDELCDPVLIRGVYENLRAHHISTDELASRHDRAINVTLSGEVKNQVESLSLKERVDRSLIGYINAYKGYPLFINERGDVLEVAGVGEEVEGRDLP
jgi:hypothetical protein